MACYSSEPFFHTVSCPNLGEMCKNGSQTSYRPVRILSLTDSLPKTQEKCTKNWKNRVFFGKFTKIIFRIGGLDYSILEVIYLIKISVRSKSIPYWRFIPFWSIPYWSFYCILFSTRTDILLETYFKVFRPLPFKRRHFYYYSKNSNTEYSKME